MSICRFYILFILIVYPCFLYGQVQPVESRSGSESVNEIDYQSKDKKIGLLGHQPDYSSLNSEEKAAYDWARENYDTVFLSFSEIKSDSKVLDSLKAVWWHFDDTQDLTLPSVATQEEVTAALSLFISNGGGVFLSGFAPQYVVDLELEDTTPQEIRRGNNGEPETSGNWGFYQVKSSHPVFDGLSNPFTTVSAGLEVDNNICWWTDPNTFDGTWLGDVEWESGNLITSGEYTRGEGKLIVVGAGAYEWHIPEGTNTKQANLEKFTGNILNYLLPSSGQALPEIEDGLIARWKFDEGSGSVANELVSNTSTTIQNNFNLPEWKEGPLGSALRFDGYSTWLIHSMHDELKPEDALTVEAWAAIEAYPVSNAPFVNNYTFPDAGYYFGMDKYGRWYLAVSVNGEWYTCWADSPFPKYQWVHIAGTFDKEAGMSIYLNGKRVGRAYPPKGAMTPDFDTDVMIGRDNHTPFEADLFPTGVLNGLVDEVKIYNRPLDNVEVQTSYEAGEPPSVANFDISENRFADDPHRPRFHPIPPANWTNEPHGLVYNDGEYHMFYQKNPNGPYWAQIHWGHMKTSDLVNWQHMPIALAPEPGYDQVGIWSGDVVINNDIPTALYTGVDDVKAGVSIATSSDGMVTWDKDRQNPVISSPPNGFKDFRDPYVWKKGDTWYLIIGTGVEGGGGTALLYRSQDLRDWVYVKPLMKGLDTQKTGTYWEMPVLAPIGSDKHIFIVNTLPQPATAYYWIGSWKNETFTPEKGPLRLDIINHFLSPTVTYDDQGRLVAIGIVPEMRSSLEQYQAGWAHSYSLPRILDLQDDTVLSQQPAPELENLRDSHNQFENIIVAQESSNHLEAVEGAQLEIKAEIDPGDAARFGLKIQQSPDGQEETRIYYDTTESAIYIDRSNSSFSNTVNKEIQSGTFELTPGEPLLLHLYIDHSVLDVFVNEREAFTSRIYPTSSNSNGIDLYAEGGTATATSVDVWQLKSSKMTGVPYRPEDDKQEEETPTKFKLHQNYPNPFNASTRIRYYLPEADEIRLEVYNILGQKVGTLVNNTLDAGYHIVEFNPINLASGIYLYRLNGSNTAEVKKMTFIK